MNTDNLRILIIDDNQSIQEDFIKVLTNTRSNSKLEALDAELFGEKESASEFLPPFKLDTALQGLEGVQKVEEAVNIGNPYALAFVDIRMPPGLDGIETIKKMWLIDPNIQIVICTAYSDYSWEDTIAHLGMSDKLLILKKPFDYITVRQLACALIKKWELMQNTKEHIAYIEKTVEQRTESLEESLSLNHTTIEASFDGILVLSKTGEIIDYNSRLLTMWKISESSMQARDYKLVCQLMSEQTNNPDAFNETMLTMGETSSACVHRFSLNDGRTIERYSEPHIVNNNILGRIWRFTDITENYSLKKKIENQATHDIPTGLPNRSLLLGDLKNFIRNSRNTKELLGLLYLDVDGFKLINDTLGYEAGDELIIRIAHRLKASLRENEIIARVGADEFLLGVKGIKDRAQLIVRANKLLDFFKAPFNVQGKMLEISVSMGIAFFPESGSTAEELLGNADLAMHQAKLVGKGKIHFYEHDVH